MCHHVHVTLSAEDKAAARKITGAMIPVFAVILLAIVAVAARTATAPHAHKVFADASVPAATR